VDVLPHLQAGVGTALAVVALRAFPVLCAVCREAVYGPLQRTIACVAYGGCAYLALRHSDFDARHLLAAYLWLAPASLALYATRLHRARLWLFVACAGGLLMIPGLCSSGNAELLALGWDAALSAFSYLAEVPPRERSVEGYWFFLFVNPTLAYPKRGKRVAEAGWCGAGLARAGRGAVSLVCAGVLGSLSASPTWDGSGFFALVTRGAALYAAHVGLAAVQIGLFRQLGHEVPERYPRPYLARSPREFWARWNTYVGSWVRLYLFDPCARALLRTRLSRNHVLACAIGSSFVFVGAYHDLEASLAARRLSCGFSAWFAANAALLVGWELIRRALSRSHHAREARFATRLVTIGLFAALLAVLP
jgi:hypothetical protein